MFISNLWVVPCSYWQCIYYIHCIIMKFIQYGQNTKHKKTRLSMSGHERLTWIRFQLQWKMRFRKGGRYRRSEVKGLTTTPIILCVVVSRSYVTRLFELDTDFRNVFTLKMYMIFHANKWTVLYWSPLVLHLIQKTFLKTRSSQLENWNMACTVPQPSSNSMLSSAGLTSSTDWAECPVVLSCWGYRYNKNREKNNEKF